MNISTIRLIFNLSGLSFFDTMALYGDFHTFPVTDLLQWIEASRKSGVVEIEQNNIKKTIVCHEGAIIACTSDDPATRLGQSLLAQRMITEEQLGIALQIQEETGQILGDILVEQGVVDQEVIYRHVSAKAEEAIYSLFDQADTYFQFDENGVEPEFLVPVNLRIQDVLLKGIQRYDEMQRIRRVFTTNGVILARTEKKLPSQVCGSKISMRLLDAVDGGRTLAEILLHTRGSEYLVTKFLFELHRKGLVKVTSIRELQEPDKRIPFTEKDLLDPTPQSDVTSEIDLAVRLVDRGEHEAAIAVLNATSRAWPGVPSVHRMIERVEAEQFGRISRDLPSSSVPVMTEPWNELSGETLSPGEAFLTTLIDGRTEIRSILWVAPMRALDVLRNLKKLVDRGMIQLTDKSALDAPISLPEDITFGGLDGGQG